MGPLIGFQQWYHWLWGWQLEAFGCVEVSMHLKASKFQKISQNQIQFRFILSTGLNFIRNELMQSFIIIIMSCPQHGYPWPSLATSPYHPSPLAGLQGHISYPHIAAVCMFELVVLLLLGHIWESIGVHHLWALPCFSSSVPHVWFV